MLDVVIVGAGPSGLACAIEARHAGLDYLVVEKGGITDAIRRFPVNMTFFSSADRLEIGGLPFTTTELRPSRIAVLEYYRRAAEHFELDLQLHCCVDAIRRVDDGFEVDTQHGTLAARSVVVATGYFDQTNRLGVPGEDLPHVSHYYDEPFAYTHMDVTVIGGRNSATEAALELYRHGARVTVIHRRPALSDSVKYWLRPDLENRLREGVINALFEHRVREIRVGELDAEHVRTGAVTTIRSDFVFPLVGYRPDERLLRAAGVSLHEETLIPEYSPETFETNVPGLYVAGSVACGCQTWDIFIENGREHANPIVDHIRQRLS